MEKTKKNKIIIIDDEIEFAELLSDRLSLRGFETEYVTNHFEALKLAEQKKFDIAIIDVKLKGINGIELMKLLLQIQPKLKVILITGHGTEEEKQRGLAFGASRYLVKPIDIENLKIEILNLFETDKNGQI
ncbi:MAG: response regulator [Candidatus Kapaibacteriota bacterium]|jgi:DNA-binding response OmpR family regulator